MGELVPENDIEITPEMIDVGVSALWRAMGFQLDGDPREGVSDAFRAMALVARGSRERKPVD